jgi:hypothetical protein
MNRPVRRRGEVACRAPTGWGRCAHGMLFALCLFLEPLGMPLAGAQVLQATGGTSTLFNASGGSLEIRGPQFTNRIDLGYVGGFREGFSMTRPFERGILELGDQTIAFRLPTDIFDQSHYFLGRGASFSRGNDDHKLFLFAGSTTQGFFAPFLNVAAIDTPTAALFYQTAVSPTLKFSSRNTFSGRQTSIQALEWSPRNDIQLAVAGGLGNNQPYGALSFSRTGNRLLADASYAFVGNEFRRVLAETPQVSEPDRENLRVEFRPLTSIHLAASRNNYAAVALGGGIERATVNGLGAWGAIRGLQIYGSMYQSTTSFGKSTASMLGGRKDITSRLGVGFDYLASSFQNQPKTQSFVGYVREVISPRLSLTQLITHASGQTSVSYGGTLIANWVSLSAEYETLYFPFAPPGEPQFRQVLALGLHFQFPHGVQLNFGTVASPTGQTRYSAYGTTFAYRTLRGLSGGTSASTAIFGNIVGGRVEDSSGEPIAGAAIRIGRDLVFSDSRGLFFIRVKSPGDLPLVVALEEFTAPGAYAVVSAPTVVCAAREDTAQEYKVILKRVPALSSSQTKHDRP